MIVKGKLHLLVSLVLMFLNKYFSNDAIFLLFFLDAQVLCFHNSLEIAFKPLIDKFFMVESYFWIMLKCLTNILHTCEENLLVFI